MIWSVQEQSSPSRRYKEQRQQGASQGHRCHLGEVALAWLDDGLARLVGLAGWKATAVDREEMAVGREELAVHLALHFCEVDALHALIVDA